MMSPATRLLLGGFLTLVVVMGIGRFYYTPLLPIMQGEHGFGPAVAGLIGSANFAGYLAGSLGASFIPPGNIRLQIFRGALLASVATTLAMGLSDALAAWLVLRFAGGVATAFAMILAAGYVAEALALAHEPGRIGWMFGGVGVGIAASGLFVRFAAGTFDAAGLWIAAGVLGFLLAPLIMAEVGERQLPPRPRRFGGSGRVPRPLPFAPPLEGLGFSVFAVFIVAIVKLRPGLEDFGDWVWVTAGLAGLPSAVLWGWAAERVGFANALVLAFAIQAIGVALPALTDAPSAALLAAVMFGGTFLGITVLSLPLGRHGFGGRGFAVLTVGFGIGQVIGPILAGFFVEDAADYDTALLASAVVLVAAALLIAGAIVARERAARPQGSPS
jgi:MFS family permease